MKLLSISSNINDHIVKKWYNDQSVMSVIIVTNDNQLLKPISNTAQSRKNSAI